MEHRFGAASAKEDSVRGHFCHLHFWFCLPDDMAAWAAISSISKGRSGSTLTPHVMDGFRNQSPPSLPEDRAPSSRWHPRQFSAPHGFGDLIDMNLAWSEDSEKLAECCSSSLSYGFIHFRRTSPLKILSQAALSTYHLYSGFLHQGIRETWRK